MENDNVISTNADKITENQKVVKGNEIVDANDDNTVNLEEIRKLNYQIGQRIVHIREKIGMNQENFYSLLYPNSRETDTTKRNRMGEIENALAFEGKVGAKIIDFPRLLFISQHFKVSLNYLLYGETGEITDTLPVPQLKKPLPPTAQSDEEIPMNTVRSLVSGLMCLSQVDYISHACIEIAPIDKSFYPCAHGTNVKISFDINAFTDNLYPTYCDTALALKESLQSMSDELAKPHNTKISQDGQKVIYNAILTAIPPNQSLEDYSSDLPPF